MQVQRRQHERFAASHEAEVRYHGGRKLKLTVLDISLGGCMVDARGWTIREGENISIKLPNLAYQPATIVWNEDSKCGIMFEEPLYEPTLEFLRQPVA